MEGELGGVRLDLPPGRREGGGEGLVRRLRGPRLQSAREVALLHGEHAARQVAEPVGEVGIEACHQRRLAELRVLPEGHVAQQVVAERVHPVAPLHGERAHHVAEALRHLARLHLPVAVDAEAAVERQPGRHQHGRPEDGVGLQDVLPDQMMGRRPELQAAAVLERAHVVEQRVEPDVGDVAVVERELDPPGEAALRPRDAEVADRVAQERQHLPAISVGDDQVRLRLERLLQARLVGAHAEEVVLLGDLRGRHAVVGADAVHQLALLVEALAAEAVEAAVAAEVDVAARVHPGQDLLHVAHVVGVRGADEVVVAEPRLLPGRAEERAHAVGVRLRRYARRRRGLRDLVPVLVGARQREHGTPARAPEARQDVAHQRHVEVAEVRLGVHVEERRGQVERLARHAGARCAAGVRRRHGGRPGRPGSPRPRRCPRCGGRSRSV